MDEDIKQAFLAAGLSQADTDRYSAQLSSAGYDTDVLLRSLTARDLQNLGLNKPGHINAILSAALKLQRVKVLKRHAFYISYDKVEAGTEAAMFSDAAAVRFSDKPAFIDTDHKYLRSWEEYKSAMIASNFCVVLLTPGYLTNSQCLAELVWAHQTNTPLCTITIERQGLARANVSFIDDDSIDSVNNLLSASEWAKLEKMEIFAYQVRSALLWAFLNYRDSLTYYPHESREIRSAFFGMLWRFLGELAAAEAGLQVFTLDQRVDVRWRKGERWYSGRVSYIAPNGSYSIQYDDGDRETGVTAEYMQRHRRPPVVVFQQDERIEARWKRRTAYYPGRVVAVFEHLDAYDIVYDDGDIEYRVSYEMIRRL